MPTAAKLFAAFAFGVLAFFAAQVFMPYMPEETQFGAFVPVSALIGAFCGWKVMGPEAGQGNWMAANSGLKTSAYMIGLALIIFSIEGMLVLAFRKTYDGPIEAVVGAIGISVDFVLRMLEWDFLVVVIVGGALAGLLSEWASRRWR